jgi:hypothetical protein
MGCRKSYHGRSLTARPKAPVDTPRHDPFGSHPAIITGAEYTVRQLDSTYQRKASDAIAVCALSLTPQGPLSLGSQCRLEGAARSLSRRRGPGVCPFSTKSCL